MRLVFLCYLYLKKEHWFEISSSGLDSDSAILTKEKLETLRHIQSSVADTSKSGSSIDEAVNNMHVGISLEKILVDPGSGYDPVSYTHLRAHET